MLDAIEEVHNMGYIHRDIKPVRQLNLKLLEIKDKTGKNSIEF